MKYAVLFPGQGSQHVGMGPDVLAARPDLFGDAADTVLGWSLSAMMTHGPEEELTRTDRAQPALFAMAYALWEALSSVVEEPPLAVAGHSVGEYAALAAAGVITFDEGLRLVARRGKAMEEVGRDVGGAMVALLGTSEEAATEIAETRRAEGGQLWVANINAPGQIVMAGAVPDIEWLKEAARNVGIRRTIPLKVSGAFHTPLIEPAAAELEKALATVSFKPPRFPVYSNVTARPMEDVPATLRDQLAAPVRFADSLRAMAGIGVDTFIHVGPGNVTAGLAAKTVPDAMTHVVQALQDVTDVALALNVV